MSDPRPEDWIALARINAESHIARKQYEFKFLLAVWAGQALALWFLVDRRVVLPADLLWLLGVAYVVAVVLICHLFVRPTQNAFETDVRWKHYYMKRAEKKEVEEPEEVRCCFGYKQPRALCHVVLTVTLAVVTIFLMVWTTCTGRPLVPSAQATEPTCVQVVGSDEEAPPLGVRIVQPTSSPAVPPKAQTQRPPTASPPPSTP